MPRRTAAEVIALGEYLEPDFNPYTLTSAQLLSIFICHDIKYPTKYTKPQLVQLFDAEIKPRADQLKKARSKKEKGGTGGSGNKGNTTVNLIDEGGKSDRGSSAPLSRTPPQEFRILSEDSGWETNNVFQSGAALYTARPSSDRVRTSVAPQPSPDRVRTSVAPQPSPDRVRTSATPPTSLLSSRSTTSDAISSSPARPSHVLSHNITAPWSSRKSRRIMSTSPHRTTKAGTEGETHEDGPADAEPESPRVDERAASLSEHLSEGRRVARPGRSSSFIRFLLVLLALVLALVAWSVLYQYKHESAQIGFCDTDKTTNAILDGYRTRLAAIDSCNRENRTTLYSTTSAASVPTSVHPPSWMASEGSQGDAAFDLGVEACPPLPLVALPHPEACTPCPRHAACTPSTITCDNGYVVYPHPFFYFVPGTLSLSPSFSKTSTTFTRPRSLSTLGADTPDLIYFAIALVLDGMPGVGPVALPPRCMEDPRRSLRISALCEAVKTMLAAERGRRICEGVHVGELEGDEAKVWGIELEQLKGELKDDVSHEPELLDTLHDTFDEVLQQLVQSRSVLISEDTAGKQYLAHRTPSMSWYCVAKVSTWYVWIKWQKSITSSILVILSVLIIRSRRAKNRAESERVAALIQVALNLLRSQELAHRAEPLTAPQPYLSSFQLRDLVLQDEHSIRVRRRLWERVEYVVEGNANVRTSLEEVEHGEELKVWRWVGSVGMN